MKKYTTSERLKQLMKERNLRQIDILNLTIPFCNKYGVKMNKSDVSQYVSGKVEPSQDKLVILSMALGVNEAWLMGFDVAMQRKSSTIQSADEDILLLQKMSLLTKRDKQIIFDMIDSFIKSGA